MTIATGAPIGRRRKLTKEQHRALADKHLSYVSLGCKRVAQMLALEFGISRETVRAYLNRRCV